jgi:hypothetical protein
MAPRALVVLRLSIGLKQQLNALRREGRTINGFVTHLLEREFGQAQQPAVKTARKDGK